MIDSDGTWLHGRGDGSCNENGFSDRDKRAIGLWLQPYPEWSVAYVVADGVEYAQVTRPCVSECEAPGTPSSPQRLTLARQHGLTGFAAHWADGALFCTGLLDSLSGALGFIVQAIEDTLGLDGPGAERAEDGLPAGGNGCLR